MLRALRTQILKNESAVAVEMINEHINRIEPMNSSGIERMFNERVEQIKKHKRTPLDDFQYNHRGELIDVAQNLLREQPHMTLFPDSWDEESVKKMYAKSYKDRLVISGALIAAEIDRLELIEIAVKTLSEPSPKPQNS